LGPVAMVGPISLKRVARNSPDHLLRAKPLPGPLVLEGSRRNLLKITLALSRNRFTDRTPSWLPKRHYASVQARSPSSSAFALNVLPRRVPLGMTAFNVLAVGAL
jgi:hypothetical protein